jgi:hypothetical protein
MKRDEMMEELLFRFFRSKRKIALPSCEEC